MPSLVVQADKHTALELAKWTAAKDFLEWCGQQVRQRCSSDHCVSAGQHLRISQRDSSPRRASHARKVASVNLDPAPVDPDMRPPSMLLRGAASFKTTSGDGVDSALIELWYDEAVARVKIEKQ